ncbi:MAG: hypothetical protein JJT78_13035 [Leptospira sp.]|nr:hypothetical protein [Leptospira sp.]
MNDWKKYLLLFIGLYGLTTLAIWKRYDMNPTGMVNFGKEFVVQNQDATPPSSVVMLGEEGDLGGGYDGQIFYYFSRPLSEFHLNWPVGFDESYRAPRIGYPFLIAIFGLFGKYSAVFGMYFWNLVLFFLSFLALRSMMGREYRLWTLLYLVSPFALGSYSVLVSDTVMVSLVVLSYFFFQKENYILFSLLGALAVITKEPALFFLFPLGLKSLMERNPKRILAVGSTLLFMVGWQLYLKYTFPHWSAGRLTDFIQPMDGISNYLGELWAGLSSGTGFKGMARVMGRLPLVLLFIAGVSLLFVGDKKKGWNFRLSMALVLFMIGSADYFYFWSVYENISRMFTLAIPVLILWKKEDSSLPAEPFALLTIAILLLFIVKLLFISQPLPHEIWVP